jgi:hypothetical protein
MSRPNEMLIYEMALRVRRYMSSRKPGKGIDRAGKAPAPNSYYWTRGILFAISYSKTASILLSSW